MQMSGIWICEVFRRVQRAGENGKVMTLNSRVFEAGPYRAHVVTRDIECERRR